MCSCARKTSWCNVTVTFLFFFRGLMLSFLLQVNASSSLSEWMDISKRYAFIKLSSYGITVTSKRAFLASNHLFLRCDQKWNPLQDTMGTLCVLWSIAEGITCTKKYRACLLTCCWKWHFCLAVYGFSTLRHWPRTSICGRLNKMLLTNKCSVSDLRGTVYAGQVWWDTSGFRFA